MRKYINTLSVLVIGISLFNCADNELSVTPNDNELPFQLVLDTEEGGDLAQAEDYGVEIKFADYLESLPSEDVVLTYDIETEGSFENVVAIDKVIYDVEINDCTYERELEFNSEAKTITIKKDADLGSLPESFEVVFLLPGADDTEGGFKFSINNLASSNDNIVLGGLRTFQYEVLDNDVAGAWALEFENEEAFNAFKDIFSAINHDLSGLQYEDTNGELEIEFEFGEMKFELELNEEEEVCEEGESDVESRTIQIEADYDAEDGELGLEGSHLIINEDDGEIEDELDFIISAEYSINPDTGLLTLIIKKIVDEDHFEEGEELFDDEVSFTFSKD